MKRSLVLLAALGCTCAGAGSAIASAQARPSTPAARAARAATVQLRRTALGNILVDSAGHTLYLFTRDRGARNSCVPVSGCSRVWPALKAAGNPTAGPGVKSSELSSIGVPGGRQVTYAGHPLYTYVGDTRAGETGYVGIEEYGGFWDALSASGQAVR